jgi:hypothetical protein
MDADHVEMMTVMITQGWWSCRDDNHSDKMIRWWWSWSHGDDDHVEIIIIIMLRWWSFRYDDYMMMIMITQWCWSCRDDDSHDHAEMIIMKRWWSFRYDDHMMIIMNTRGCWSCRENNHIVMVVIWWLWWWWRSRDDGEYHVKKIRKSKSRMTRMTVARLSRHRLLHKTCNFGLEFVKVTRFISAYLPQCEISQALQI